MKHAIGTSVAALAGLYLLLTGLSFAVTAVSTGGSIGMTAAMVVLVAVALIAFRKSLGSWLVPEDGGADATFAIVLLRLTGLMLAFGVLQKVAGVVWMMDNPGRYGLSVRQVLALSVVDSLGAIACLVFAEAIATWLTGAETADSTVVERCVAAGSACIALYLLLRNAPLLIFELIQSTPIDSALAESRWSALKNTQFLPHLLTSVFALGTFFGRAAIARTWRRARMDG